MSVWFTSDLHIGHAKVAEIRGEEFVCGLLAKDAVEYHDAYLGEHWDLVVKESDQVWVLGDISSGTKTGQLKALEWIKERPGQKHLICGNHDSCHPLHRDSHKWQGIYLEAFESVQMAGRRKISWDGGSCNVLLSHFPYGGDHTEEDRYTQWRLPDEGEYLLHGHVHNSAQLSLRWTTKPQDYVARQIHVGVDAWDFAPVPLETIVELVNQ